MPRSRRPAGQMRENVLHELVAARRPLSGTELITRLARDGERIYNSQVFRAIDQLSRAGEIRKIALTSSYTVGGRTRVVSLSCGKCGALTEAEADAAFAAIDALAAQSNFTVGRYFVEVGGLCPGCADDSPETCGSA